MSLMRRRGRRRSLLETIPDGNHPGAPTRRSATAADAQLVGARQQDASSPVGAASSDEFQEAKKDVLPDDEQVLELRKRPYSHLDQTRRWLAGGILAGLFLLDLLAMAALITRKLSIEEFKDVMLALSGPQALAAAAVGFFFATSHKRQS